MRPPRILILVLFFAASLFLFCRAVGSIRSPGRAIAPATPQKSSFRSFFSFTAPFTLFPPNAIITLTDDNSTFLPARPAAFGPPLPSKGLSGQLWIGSGFADENLPDGEGEGELGCSDVPGYDHDTATQALKAAAKGLGAKTKNALAAGKKGSKRGYLADGLEANRAAASYLQPQHKAAPVNDGTDDYLHQGLAVKKPSHEVATSGTDHADIQSIQEAAEITGKIVLLSRGGCGFLEKVKWAQRRGAVALIVGDNQKGGPLVQMFARGDTSNVTIPAIFTSRTTAHLLSSLMQPGSFIEDTLDENGKPALKVQQFDAGRKGRKGKKQATATATMATPKPTATPRSGKSRPTKKSAPGASQAATPKSHGGGWLSRLLRFGRGSGGDSDRSRPPSSGRLDWVLVDEWNDEKDEQIRSGLEAASTGNAEDGTSQQAGGDGFQIGVQDWRDPDLVHDPSGRSTRDTTGSSKTGSRAHRDPKSGKPRNAETAESNGPKGGSITPGSGEYAAGSSRDTLPPGSGSGQDEDPSAASSGLLSKIFGDDDEADFSEAAAEPRPTSAIAPVEAEPFDSTHEGLWVTITPAGGGPFWDTMLVLLISPVFTLTVVYALLILRARIRRRRWRAPKSVVERLPVRTYHTVAATPSHSSRVPSPTSSSPTTPLLQGSPRSRPRSRTTTGIPDTGDLLRVDAALQGARSPSRGPSHGAPRTEHEKGPGRASQWKKYMGRQVECVVCLEEYVDGVSQVMSLPCGHEFHAECITPWLTTRRRTCPICKGDVVRSLAGPSSSSPRYEPYRDDSDDDITPEGSGAMIGSPPDRDSDLEQGILSPTIRQATRRPNRGESWLRALPHYRS